jgi:hypothetical protein
VDVIFAHYNRIGEIWFCEQAMQATLADKQHSFMNHDDSNICRHVMSFHICPTYICIHIGPVWIPLVFKNLVLENWVRYNMLVFV